MFCHKVKRIPDNASLTSPVLRFASVQEAGEDVEFNLRDDLTPELVRELTHYEILGFEKYGNGVGDEGLKKAYRKAVLKYHPDKTGVQDGEEDEVRGFVSTNSRLVFVLFLGSAGREVGLSVGVLDRENCVREAATGFFAVASRGYNTAVTDVNLVVRSTRTTIHRRDVTKHVYQMTAMSRPVWPSGCSPSQTVTPC